MQMLKIRMVRKEDVNIICQIAVGAWEPIFRGFRKVMGEKLFNLEYGSWQEMKTSEVRDVVTKKSETVLVTELEGKIVGFSTFGIDAKKKIGEIGNNAVDPHFQGKGIGKKQHAEIMRILKEKGILFVKVVTGLDKAHKAARISYEHVGFKQTIKSVTYYYKL